jgi:D-alanyl-D-alanine carboxypeptidase
MSGLPVKGEIFMSDLARITRRGFVRAAGVVTAGVGLGSVMGAARAGAITAEGRAVAGQGLSPGTASRLDAAIRTVMKQARIPGSIVGLWMPGGSYVRTFGVADKVTGAPMQTDFYMRIGSETKTFTVSALLQLVDQGLIGLDDPIAKYIPDVPDGQQITIRELARMQSGLYNYSASPQFTEALYEDPYRAWTPQQLLAYSFSRPLNFPPGTGWEYSNTNTVLLGLVVELVSGQPLRDYLRHHIFRPFGLRHTIFPVGSEFPFPHAHGYSTNELTGEPVDATDWNPSWGWAAGAMISTLSDLRRWAPILAAGHGLVTPQTQAERLQTVHIPGAPPDVLYGLGLFVIAGWIGHNGSLPGYQSLTIYLPGEHATLVILINTDNSYQNQEPSTLLGEAITEIVTPDHVYGK